MSNDSALTPAALGYRMPAEWEPHAGTWLTWPRPDGISFPGKYEPVPDAYAAVRARMAELHQPRSLVEFEVFGTTHAEVGAYLLGLWALPLSIVEAVAHHHAPERLTSENPLLDVLWAANELSHGRDPRPRVSDPRVGQRVSRWLERHGGADGLDLAGVTAPQRGTS